MSQCEPHAHISAGLLWLERLPAVIARTGLSRSQLYWLVSLGRFPSPVKLSERSSAWNAAEVDRWIETRIAERDANIRAKRPASSAET